MAISGVGTIFKKVETKNVVGQKIAVADGALTTFSGDLKAELVCSSFKVYYKIGGVSKSVTADANGNISSTDCSGRIDCKKGKWSLTFTTAPDAGDITADYIQTAKLIGNIKSIKGPTMSRATLDTTALDTEGGYRTFITGFRDAGELTLTLDYTYETYQIMLADFQSNVPVLYKIELPDEEKSSFSFYGLVTAVPLTIPEEIVTFEVTIKLSGPITLTKGV